MQHVSDGRWHSVELIRRNLQCSTYEHVLSRLLRFFHHFSYIRYSIVIYVVAPCQLETEQCLMGVILIHAERVSDRMSYVSGISKIRAFLIEKEITRAEVYEYHLRKTATAIESRAIG